MNWVDYLIILFFILNILGGFANGFVSGVIEFVRFLISLAVALVAFPAVAVLLRLIGVPSDFSFFFGFFFALVGVQVLLAIIGRPLTKRLKRAVKSSDFRAVDKFLGPIPQIVMLAISLSFFLALLVSFPIYNPLKAAIINSRYGKPLAQPALSALAAVSKQVKHDVNSYSI
jgi:uncharacterized membrane protein required for colicin V production